MIYRKIFVFPMFVCTLEKCFGKYFTLCVWSNVKQNKTKPTPKITGNGNHHCQPNPQPTTNSTSHNNPPPITGPQANPQQPTADHRSSSQPNPQSSFCSANPKPTDPRLHRRLPRRDPVERNTQRRDRPNPGPRVGSRSGPCTKRPGATCPDLIGVAGVAWGGWDGSGWLGRERRQRAESKGREKRQRKRT